MLRGQRAPREEPVRPGRGAWQGRQERVALCCLQALKSSLTVDSGSECVCLSSNKPAFGVYGISVF